MLAEALKVAPAALFTTPMPTMGDVRAKLVCTGARKCGRTHKVTATRAKMKATSVVTIAGWTRQMATPAVTPSAKANSA
jgi:hypothetical protein